MARAENEVRRRSQAPGRSWSIDFETPECCGKADEVFPPPPGFAGRLHRMAGPFCYALRRIRSFDVLHMYFGKSMLRFEGRLGFVGRIDLPLWKRSANGSSSRSRVAMVAGFARIGPAAFLSLSPRRLRCPFLRRGPRSKAKTLDRPGTPLGRQVLLRQSQFVALRARRRIPALLLRSARTSGADRAARHRRLRILHAPTNRAIKGTSLLLAASRQLESTHPHELDLVEGASHDEAVRRSAEVDIVVDQVRIGWYGGLAMEAMASGRPTVAFLNDDDLARIPAAMRSELPIVNASPESLPERLAGLLENAALRTELGQRGTEFVRRWHHPLKIARRLLDLYADPSQSFWEGYCPDEEV